jgi:uncharacterized peroxidase-related enzyme
LESHDQITAERLTQDFRAANLSAADRALCDFAAKLTLAPGKMTVSDINGLRDAGWSDEQIHIATQVVAYFNYINRIADALGVDNESWMSPPKEQWLASKANDYKSAHYG